MFRFLFFSLVCALTVSAGAQSVTDHSTAAKADGALVDTLTERHPEYQSSLPLGEVVPDFEAKDTLGNTVRLTDFRGSYVVLDFWATWCGDCRREIPMLKQLYAEKKGLTIGGKAVRWLSFSFDTDANAWRHIVAKEQFEWTQVSNLLSTRDDPTFKAYQLHWIPAFLIIDPEGRLVSTAITADALRKNIMRAINNE